MSHTQLTLTAHNLMMAIGHGMGMGIEVAPSFHNQQQYRPDSLSDRKRKRYKHSFGRYQLR